MSLAKWRTKPPSKIQYEIWLSKVPTDEQIKRTKVGNDNFKLKIKKWGT